MGIKASNLMWCEYNSETLSHQNKSANYIYCYRRPPPSYNHNWTDLHYAASHGNVRRIHEIIHKTGIKNTVICSLGNFEFFCHLLIFSKSTFSKNSFRNIFRVSNSLDPDQAQSKTSGLVWVQTACKGYQQMTLVGKEF